MTDLVEIWRRICKYIVTLRIVGFVKSRCCESGTLFQGLREILTYFYIHPIFFLRFGGEDIHSIYFFNYEFREYRRSKAIFYLGPEMIFGHFHIYCSVWVEFGVGDLNIMLLIGRIMILGSTQPVTDRG